MQYGVDRFLEVRTAYCPSFSPDGRSIVYLTDTTGLPQVWKVDLADPVPKQITSLDDRIALVRYSPVTRHLIIAMDSDGDENMQLFLVDDTGTSCEPLTANPAARHLFGGWSPDGRRIAFYANIRNRAYFDLYVMDLVTRTTRQVYENNVLGDPAAFWMGNSTLITAVSESSSKQTLFYVDLLTGQVRKMLDTDDESSLGAAEPDPVGQRLYVTTYLNSDFHGLATLDLSRQDPVGKDAGLGRGKPGTCPGWTHACVYHKRRWLL
jgi:Tol biopolymer transport system component